MKLDSRIFVASEKTTAGKAILSDLRRRGYRSVVSDEERGISLSVQSEVDHFFQNFKPEYIFFTGAMSAGIAANQTIPGTLASENLLGLCHIFNNAVRWNSLKVLYLASSCIYPKNSPQPMKVEALFTGPLEPTSEAYATAKLAGISLAEACRHQYGLNIITAIPSDLYGPEDSFESENSHVVEALIQKIHHAKSAGHAEIVIWGSGKPVRDFLFSEDLADACHFLMNQYEDKAPVNISGNSFCSISELAALIKKITGFEGSFAYDTGKPDGAAQKTLQAQPLSKLGWKPRFSIDEGLRKTYQAFLKLEVSTGVS